MNLCHKKVSNIKEFTGIVKPKIKEDSRVLFHKKNEKNDKIVILEDRNKITKIDEKKDGNQTNKSNSKINNKTTIKFKDRNDENNNNTNNKPIINDNIEKMNKIKIQIMNKSTNNLINIFSKTKNNNYKITINNKSKTEDKKENKLYNENFQKIISIDIKKCKLFTSLPNVIENINRNISKINNRNILRNFAFKSHSINNAHLPKPTLEANHLLKKKIIKIPEINKKVKYKLKSIKYQKKENDNNKNNNITLIKSICDNNIMKKEIKYYKSMSKYCNFQSFSVNEDNYNITRYKLGNYLSKRNNRYQEKNLISEDKTKKYAKNVWNRYNIASKK